MIFMIKMMKLLLNRLKKIWKMLMMFLQLMYFLQDLDSFQRVNLIKMAMLIIKLLQMKNGCKHLLKKMKLLNLT